MSSKRIDLPTAPLCRFSFADGRRCALPAHPEHDGLCLPHASRNARPPRRDDLARNFTDLAREDISPSELLRALENVQRLLANRRELSDRASVLTYLGKIILEGELLAHEQSFRKGSGRHIDNLRKLLDSPAPDSTPKS